MDPGIIMYVTSLLLDSIPFRWAVIGQLIRQLNDALGASSIVVTHDVQESLKMVDYIYFLSEGKVVAEGTPDEIRASTNPWVHQFVWAEPDGPVPFQYPAPPLANALRGVGNA